MGRLEMIPKEKYGEAFTAFRSSLETALGAQKDYEQFMNKHAKDLDLLRDPPLAPIFSTPHELTIMAETTIKDVNRRMSGQKIRMDFGLKGVGLADRVATHIAKEFSELSWTVRSNSVNLNKIRASVQAGKTPLEAVVEYNETHGRYSSAQDTDLFARKVETILDAEKLLETHGSFVERHLSETHRLNQDKGFTHYVKRGGTAATGK